ncbi:MAG: AraC family transcriptional regulator [Lachnospiraceae bacterium]|nr:AraC family transcriptional regulator [Lachnospiraceae bacterium]
MLWYYLFPEIEDVKELPFYLITIGLHDMQPKLERPEGYPYDQFMFSTSGSGKLVTGGKTYDLPEGSAFFIPAGVPHAYYPDGDIWDIRWMTPSGSALPQLLEQLGLTEIKIFELRDEAELDRILNKMRTDLILHPKHGPILAAGSVYNYIIEFMYQCELCKNGEAKENSHEAQMLLLKEYIGKHFMYPVTMEDLCNVVKVTKQHMCRIFKETVSMRPMEYVNYVRIDMAKGLLFSTDYPIKEVGEKCGFNNTNYFIKTFRKFEKMTPLEYRQSLL